MKSTLLIVTAAVLALLAGIAAQYWLAPGIDTRQTQLAAFTLADVNGKPRHSDEWQGKIRVLNFWATWCPPCRAEIPTFVALQNEYGDRGLQFIGIALEPPAAVKAFMQTTPVNYPMLVSESDGMALARRLGNRINAVPFTVITDRQGNIVHRQPGELSRQTLLAILEKLGVTR